ncbi:MAG: hypothetical protein IPH95_10625 [Candidatus Promineofilum sp.]|nr:hypothetical protein [Promineifilum sp.]
MPAWSVVLLLPVAALVPGWLVVRQFGRGRPSLPLAFAALSLGLAVLGWAALLLAEVGLFSMGRLALVWLLLVGALVALDLWRVKTDRRPPSADRHPPPATRYLPLATNPLPWPELVFLAIWAVAAGWLFFRPHEYVLGAADAGVYVSLGASIAHEGRIVITDETLAALDPALMPALLRPLPDDPVAAYYLLPGFYVIGAPPGEITPQFYPLHPVWLAVAYGLAEATAAPTAEAIRAALLLNGLWAALGALAVYFTVRQFAGWPAAALALVALSLTALQVWFARYPTTEMLTQFVLWSGLCGLGHWLGGDGPGKLWALLAGVSLGLVFLVRVDMLVLLPLLALLVFWLLAGGRRAAAAGTLGWFLAPLGLLVAHSFAHAWFQSRPYFVVHSGLGLRLLQVNWAIPVVAALAAVAFLWLLRRSEARFLAGYARYRRMALGALIGVTLIVAVYGWFVRPAIGAPVARQDFFSGGSVPLTDHENWRRLGWYLSPVGVWLGVAGTCLLIWRANRRMVMVLAVGALFAMLYLWSLQANPHQVYAMRRFVPAAVPFLTVAAAALLGWLVGLRRPWPVVAVALAVVWLGGLAWSARGFVSQVDHRGLTAQLDALDGAFAPDSVLLFHDAVPIGAGDFFGTPLQFIYGHNAFALRDPDPPGADLVRAVEIWHNSGRAVYWIGDPAWLDAHGYEYETNVVTLTSRRLEESYEHKPAAILDDEWVLRIARIAP